MERARRFAEWFATRRLIQVAWWLIWSIMVIGVIDGLAWSTWQRWQQYQDHFGRIWLLGPTIVALMGLALFVSALLMVPYEIWTVFHPVSKKPD